MKRVWLFGSLVLVLLLANAGYSAVRTASVAGALGPAEVVSTYYDWYLNYIGDRGAGPMRNPLVDGAYRLSPYLAPQFVAEVDELVASFDGGGFDPFLLAQDIPEQVKAGEAVITGQVAVVPVTTSFAGHGFTVSLEQASEGSWLITAVTPAR